MYDQPPSSPRPGGARRAAIAIAIAFGLLALVAIGLVWGLRATERPDTIMNTTPGGHSKDKPAAPATGTVGTPARAPGAP